MANAPSLLIIGARGMLGSRLVEACAARGIACIPITRAECDLATLDAATMDGLIAQHAPSHIINAAAFTAVDAAESQQELAIALNATAPAIIASAAQKHGIPCIHFSTDYVFDGAFAEPYSEEMPTRPLNQYGASKLAGEQAALAAGATVFRVQWLYDIRGTNFLMHMTKLLASRDTLRIVADQWGAPTWAKSVADLVLNQLDTAPGLYHLAAGGFTSWHGFTCAIHAAMPSPATHSILAITTAEYPLAATRPLDTRLTSNHPPLPMPHWQTDLQQAMKEWYAS